MGKRDALRLLGLAVAGAFCTEPVGPLPSIATPLTEVNCQRPSPLGTCAGTPVFSVCGPAGRSLFAPAPAPATRRGHSPPRCVRTVGDLDSCPIFRSRGERAHLSQSHIGRCGPRAMSGMAKWRSRYDWALVPT